MPKTKSELMADVYESIAKSKGRQLMWAIGRLNEAERILAMVRDATSVDEALAAGDAARVFLVRKG